MTARGKRTPAKAKLILPDFIAVGPGRTGTTWLNEALRSHVGLPHDVKETAFWSLHYDKGLEWYAWHFRHCTRDLPVAEVCPYFPFEEARRRIWKHLPDCKIVITLRDPVERAHSQYRMLSRMAIVRGPFELELERHHLLKEGARYGHHLGGWIEQFGSNNVLITFYEDLKADCRRYLGDICDFLNIPRIDPESCRFDSRARNSYQTRPRSLRVARKARRLYYWLKSHRRYRTINALEYTGVWRSIFDGGELFPPLAPGTDAWLREKLLPEVEAIERITGRDLSAWKSPRALRWRRGGVGLRA